MTPALKAVVEAMATELKRQADDGAGRSDGPGTMSRFALDGIFDLEKVARAGLEAIPPEELAAAIIAGLDPTDFYIFGSTDGVPAGEREDLTGVGIDGSGDLVAAIGRALKALAQGLPWKPNDNGVLVARLEDDAILKEQP